MLLTPHTIVGVAIASSIHNPATAFTLAVASHFAADLVPHWDFFTNVKTREEFKENWRIIACMADLSLGVAVGMYFTLHAYWVLNNPALAFTTFICGIGAVLPDAISGMGIFSSQEPKGIPGLLGKIQTKLNNPANIFWGTLTQISTIIFSLLVINS